MSKRRQRGLAGSAEEHRRAAQRAIDSAGRDLAQITSEPNKRCKLNIHHLTRAAESIGHAEAHMRFGDPTRGQESQLRRLKSAMRRGKGMVGRSCKWKR